MALGENRVEAWPAFLIQMFQAPLRALNRSTAVLRPKYLGDICTEAEY